MTFGSILRLALSTEDGRALSFEPRDGGRGEDSDELRSTEEPFSSASGGKIS